jgi:hypothetical protein
MLSRKTFTYDEVVCQSADKRQLPAVVASSGFSGCFSINFVLIKFLHGVFFLRPFSSIHVMIFYLVSINPFLFFTTTFLVLATVL